MAYVTFIGECDGVTLESVAVALFTLQGALVAHETFDTRTPSPAAPHLILSPGKYLATGAGDGFRYPLHFPLEVREGDGPSLERMLEVVLPATSTAGREQTLPCRVTGRIEMDSPSGGSDRALVAQGTTYDVGPSMRGQTRRNAVWFRRVSPEIGETPNLNPGRAIKVPYDRHGCFEALLSPDQVYSVSLPGTVGLRYFRSPGPAEEADLFSLIDALQAHSFSEMV